MVSRTPRGRRARRTGRRRESDQWLKTGGERRADPAHFLQRLQRAEATVRIPVGDDPRRQGGADPRQGVQFCRGGSVEIDGAGRRRRRGCTQCKAPGARGRARRLGGRRGPAASAARHCRIHQGDLPRQCLAVTGRYLGSAQDPAPPHPEPQRRDRGHEEERASFRRGRHGVRSRRPRCPPLPDRCRPAQISRSRARATSPTICSVRCDTLSSVSSGVWCHG